MKRRLFGLLFVLTLLLALPFAAAADEGKEVTLTMTEDTWTYTDTVTFSVTGPDGEAVPNGEVGVKNGEAGSYFCYEVNNGAAVIPASKLVSDLGLTLGQETQIFVIYMPADSDYVGTADRPFNITVNKGVLTRVEMTGYTGYEYGKPANGFSISNVSAGASVLETRFRDAEGAELTGNFEEKAYALWVRLGATGNYMLPTNQEDLTVTLNGQAATVNDGYFVFQLEPLVRSFTVTFKTAYGTPPQPQSIQRGGFASEPTAPTADDHVFKGWYTDSTYTTPFDFAQTAINEDTTLYAKWVKSYTVTFHGNNHGGSTIPRKMTVAADEPVKEPTAPTEKDYLFKGWYTDEACTTPFEFNKTINGDMDLYAKWVEAPVVSFDANGHGTAPASVCTDANGKVTKPSPDPTEKGYAFKGWYTEKACLNPFDFEKTVVEKDTTLYAKWVETYTVTFDRNGHGKAPDAQTVEKSEKATEPTAPTEKGWRFDGWYTDKECTKAYNFNTNVTADTTLYAKWTQMYTLTFNTNGGTKIESEEFADGELVYLGDYKPTKSGYYFVGWHTTSDLKRSSRVSYVRMDSNKTVYAKFAIADKTNPKTADPAMPGLAMAVLSFSAVGLAAVGFKKRK